MGSQYHSGFSIASSDENQSLSNADLAKLLREHSKYKERSYSTSNETHIPSLNKQQPTEPRIVLFGTSMFERMKTTGNSPDLAPWPSETMLTAPALERLQSIHGSGMKRLDGVFNAGVGGDKIENMLYRLVGDSSRELVGLVPIFRKRDVRLWIVGGGTNNLHKKHGYRDKDCDLLRLVMQTLLAISRPETKILLTEIFYRKDIPDDLVDEANEKLRSLATLMNANLDREAIVLLRCPEISKDEHLVDHVHLTGKGYRLWAGVLAPKAASMFAEATG